MKNIFKSKRSFTIALCLCLLAVGGAGIYSYTKIADKLNDSLIGQNSNTSDPTVITEQAVDSPQTSVTKPPETSAATEADSSENAKEVEAPVTDIKKEEPAVPQSIVRPLDGKVLNAFSGGELVKSSTLNVWKTHDGVDIAGELNEKVKSMTSGTVTRIYEDQMLGACVIIDHGNNLEGYYCNLNKDIPVIEGQKVSAGTIIGSVGNTAESEIKEASHLHFALKKNGEWIDPIALISGEGS